MEALTVEYAIKNKFTFVDCIKYFNPSWTNEECDFYLWECTCYPFSTEDVIKQLNQKFIIT